MKAPHVGPAIIDVRGGRRAGILRAQRAWLAMSTFFPRLLHLLASSRARGNAIALGLFAVLLVGWSVWLACGKLAVQAVSRSARIESADLPLEVQSDVDGIVAWSDLCLGRVVKAGDLLVQLDTTNLELRRREQLVRIDGAVLASRALEDQLAREEQARDSAASVAIQSAAAGAARAAAARATSATRAKESEVLGRLEQEQLATRLELIRAQGDSERSHAESRAAIAQALSEASLGRSSVVDRETRLAALRFTLAQMSSQSSLARAELATLDYELSRRQIRATAAGTLADITPAPPGMRAAAGMRLATIVPDSRLRVVANYVPQDAIGHVEPGQHVVLRVDNFSWSQYGTVDAVVERVGTEPRGGLVRVEMRIARDNPAVPLRHGMTAQAEVDVERVAPLSLLLRLAGQAKAPVIVETRAEGENLVR